MSESLKAVVRAVLEKAGPMENRNETCEALVSAILAMSAIAPAVSHTTQLLPTAGTTFTAQEGESPHYVLRGILQDYLISESEMDSVEFDAVYSRKSVTELVTEVRARLAVLTSMEEPVFLLAGHFYQGHNDEGWVQAHDPQVFPEMLSLYYRVAP